jgi:hypothetical protein
MSQYISAPAEARNQYQNVWNPFAREELVAKDRAGKMKQWSTFNDILGQRMGDVKDVVGEGVAGWQGVVQQANVLYQNAAQRLQQAWGEYTQAAGMQQQADQLATQQSQWEQEFGLTKDKFDWQKIQDMKPSGGGSGGEYAGDQASLIDFWAEQLATAATPADQQSIMMSIPSKISNAVVSRSAQIQHQAKEAAAFAGPAEFGTYENQPTSTNWFGKIANWFKGSNSAPANQNISQLDFSPLPGSSGYTTDEERRRQQIGAANSALSNDLRF